MCDLNLVRCDLWSETTRKARKEHRCSCCRRTIRKGEEYLVHFSVYDGLTNWEKSCTECAKDRDEFGAEHMDTPAPSAMPVLLQQCIEEGLDSEERWGSMLKRIEGRK